MWCPEKESGGFSEGPEERPGVPTGLRSRDCGPYCGSENQSKSTLGAQDLGRDTVSPSSHSAPPPPGSQGRPGRDRSSLSSESRVPLGLPTRVSRVRAPRVLLPPRCAGPSSAMPPKRPALLASARSALRTRCARSRPRPIRPPPHPTGYFGLDP